LYAQLQRDVSWNFMQGTQDKRLSKMRNQQSLFDIIIDIFSQNFWYILSTSHVELSWCQVPPVEIYTKFFEHLSSCRSGWLCMAGARSGCLQQIWGKKGERKLFWALSVLLAQYPSYTWCILPFYLTGSFMSWRIEWQQGL
jgi:hypothetical protein